MERRTWLRLGGQAVLWSALVPLSPMPLHGGPRRRAPTDRLFFGPEEVPRIRTAARTPLLAPFIEPWKAESPAALREAFDRVVATGNLLYDMRDALQALTRSCTVQLIEPDAARASAILYGIETFLGLPKWDYMMDGDTDVIGLMRASMATSRFLFAREVLGEALNADLDAALLSALAEKGCLPCYRTIYGMDHPGEVKGWRFDDAHRSTFDLNLERWPEILGANNLRAVPTMGLGLGALALRGVDARAEEWLATAVGSARRFLSYFSPDGSYFEGLSYVDYALRTLLMFIDAHQRLDGSVDWRAEANWEGIVDFILTLQAGRRPDGTPDIVNFSDSRKSVYPCIPAWIARQTGSGPAQYAAVHASEPGFFLDVLWFEPERPTAPPPARLKNRLLDLGWIVCRSGWEAGDAVLAFRSGGPANHEHADRNSFLYKIYGERLLTDPAGAAYDRREPGWLLRLTEAHNAVLIDGRGHQYHDGEEGTNESLAEASVVRFVDEGDRVWWCSDATPAYRLVDSDVDRVLRTVAFARPNVVLVLDHVAKRTTPSVVEVRFFPDNTDGAARLATRDAGFSLGRGDATLHAGVFAEAPYGITLDKLDLPTELGVFPFARIVSPHATAHTVLTVLVARPHYDDPAPAVRVLRDEQGWTFDVDGHTGRIVTTEAVPEVRWGAGDP